MYICYLDFDGVLHDETVWLRPNRSIVLRTPGRRLFEWESILIDLLASHPDVKIVLSTAWVRARSFAYAKRQLHKSLQPRVIGATFHSRLMVDEQFAALPRGMKIWGDVRRRNPTDWLAIDDDSFGWPAWCRDKLVLTPGSAGISNSAVQTTIRRRLDEWQSLSG